ncbi:ATP-binding protein [Halalkalibacillus halophilus]|uniref:ATP-binding protein n=1 Tax=Halalkalibacillus halophilus TaxID=392827 RepID=UPI0003FD5911|nr:ATP-binding protein [Halalkalibacillus halophilus]
MDKSLTFIEPRSATDEQSFTRINDAASKWIDNYSMNVHVVFDDDFNIHSVSASVKSLFGYTQEEVLSASLLYFIHPKQHEELKAFVQGLEENSRQRIELLVKNANSEYIHSQSYAGKIVDPETGKPYYVAVAQDISDQKQAAEMLVRSEKLSTAGQLSACVAHEIRNPITSLKGFLQLMDTNMKGKEAYLKIMKDEIEKIEAISSELLYIAKPSTNTFQEDDLIIMLKEVCTLMRSQARINDIKIKQDFNMNQFTLHCDRSHLKQVFINLIKNAIEAMEDPGTIEVNVYYSDYLTIDVIDQGCGVPDELKAKLGQPFLTTKSKGTGLGLMISKDILKKHDATIQIIDHEPTGSIFRVQFLK